MEITIKEIECALNSIKIVLEHTEKGYYPEQFKTHEECLKEVMNIARKYQKVQEIVKSWKSDTWTDGVSYGYMEQISEVLEDGKID